MFHFLKKTNKQNIKHLTLNSVFSIIIWCCITILISTIDLSAQMYNKQLTVGDYLPNIKITNLYNSKVSTINTLDFKDKLLIIDFWATGCKGCVLGLPKMEVLENIFGTDKLKVLPVTNESYKQVREFWSNNKFTKNLRLPTVVEDDQLSLIFKHAIIPHEVWIYKNKVIAITSEEYVDSINVKNVFDGKHIHWPVKYDYYNYDFTKPLITMDTTNVSKSSNIPIRHLGLTGYKDEINSVGFSGGSGIIRRKETKTLRAYSYNESLYVFYALKWLKILKMSDLVKPEVDLRPNQIVWEVKNRARYRFTKSEGYSQTWIRQNGLCFESLSTDTGQNDKDVYLSMIKDMNHLLGLDVRWEKRKEKVWILREIDSQKSNRYFSIGSKNTVSIKNILDAWSENEDHQYLFDERKLKMDIAVDFALKDNDSLNNINIKIRPYGLLINEELRVVDKLVFSEK